MSLFVAASNCNADRTYSVGYCCMKSNMSYPMDFTFDSTIPFKLDFNRVFLKMERMNLSIVIPVQGHFSQLHDLLGDLQCLVAEVLVVEAVAAAGESTSIQSDPLNLRDQCKAANSRLGWPVAV